MKRTLLSCRQGGERNCVLEFPWRWGAADRMSAGRAIEFAMDKNSLCRIGGNVRGVRIDCRQGRLWLTQAGAAADVILSAGQNFVAEAGGAIVVQPVPSFNDAGEAALGALTVLPNAVRLKIHHRPTAAAPARIGMDLVDRDQTGTWEHLAFIAVWLCGVFSVWHCLKTVLAQY